VQLPRIKYAFLTLPRYSMIALSNAVEPLRMANILTGQTVYEWSIVSLDGQPTPASNGLQLSPTIPLEPLGAVDILFVCGGVDVQAGENSIDIESLSSGSPASVQAVANYYISWNGLPVADSTRPGNPDALRLAVKFDKTDARAGDEIHCSVKAERIGSQGWGMLIAEIGLPPGADVDRRVLDQVVDSSGWTISHYDVLPDRVVLYLWPQAGGTSLSFAFRPRYGLKARTAPSILYDYYNPDAQVALTPTDFTVQSKPESVAEKKIATK